MHEHPVAHAGACTAPEVTPALPGEPSVKPPGGAASRWQRIGVALWTRPAWLAPLAVLGCIGAALTYVLAYDRSDDTPRGLGPCAFKLLTGLDCPGCGGTRMVWWLAHGNLPQAARHHVVALVAVPVLLYAYAAWVAHRVFHLALPTWRIPPVAWGGFFAAWMVFAVVRNLPWEPFTYFYV